MKSNKFKIALLLLTLIGFIGFFNSSSNADSHESAYVKDNAGVLNTQTIHHIDDLNDHKLSKIKGHPQYAVITLDGIPNDQDIDDYAHDEASKLGIGQKNWNNGMLFVLDVKDHKYRLEVGTGLQGALPDGDKSRLVTRDVQSDLKQEDYDGALTLFSDKMYKTLYDNRKDVYTPAQQKQKAKEDANEAKIFKTVLLVIVGLLGAFLIIVFLTVTAYGMITSSIQMKQDAEIKKALLNPEVKDKLKDANIDDPADYVGDISDKDKKRLFKDKTLDTVLLVALLTAAYATWNTHDDDLNDHDDDSDHHYSGGSVSDNDNDDEHYSGGSYLSNDDSDDDDTYSGGSDDSSDDSSFGDFFGGDSGGYDGGGFDGSW